MLTILLLMLIVSVAVFVTDSSIMKKKPVNWQSQVAPGQLSKAHAQLATNCAACHTSVKGVDDAKCITCNADNKALLQRQPTAFHAVISTCASCHIEHRGADANMRVMDHEALARISVSMIGGIKYISNQQNNEDLPADHPLVSSLVSQLNCARCHSTKHIHVELFGQNCVSCHATTQWTIPAFQHPSVNSINCAQCHQAPPSHYMMHFEMIDKTVAAAQGNGCCATVQVNQCYSCHQTTSFNDIKGVGYYKHH